MLDELQSMIQKELSKLNSLNTQKETPIIPPLSNKSKSPINKPSTEPQCSFRPMLSKKSLMIASRLGDPQERLTKVKPKTPDQPARENRPRSITSTGAPRWEQLYSLNQFYKTKKEALKAQYEQERKENEATFQPDLSKSQLNYSECSMPFEQRTKYWEARKQEKIQEQQKEILNESQNRCTFKPKLEKQIIVNDTKMSEFNKHGMINYLARIKQAQKMKEKPEVKSKWKNRITIPQEFVLGKRG